MSVDNQKVIFDIDGIQELTLFGKISKVIESITLNNKVMSLIQNDPTSVKV